MEKNLIKPTKRKEIKKLARRDFLKKSTIGLGAVIGLMGAEFYTADRIYNAHILPYEDKVRMYEKLIQEGFVEVSEAVSNKIQKNLNAEKVELESSFTKKIKDWKDMDIITPQDYQELELRISTIERQAKDAEFSERMQVLSDQLSHKILALESDLEDNVPNPLQGVWGKLREWHGYDTAETKLNRDRMYQRLDGLVKIYAAERNSKIAQTTVVKRLNELIRTSDDIEPIEQRLYSSLLEEHNKDGGADRVRDFILNYDINKIALRKRDAYSELVDYIQESDNLYQQRIKLQLESLKNLQDVYDNAKTLQNEIRSGQLNLAQIDKKVKALDNKYTSIDQDLQALGHAINYDNDFGFQILPGIIKTLYNVIKYGAMGTTAVLGVNYLMGKRKQDKLKSQVTVLESTIIKMEAAQESGQQTSNKSGLDNQNTQNQNTNNQNTNDQNQNGYNQK